MFWSTRRAGSDRAISSADVAGASVDVRLLPRQEQEAFLAELVRVVGDTGIAITVQGPTWPATESPAETVLFRAIVAAARERTPGAPVPPPPQSGVTDGHYFRRFAIASYGLSPLPLDPGA